MSNDSISEMDIFLITHIRSVAESNGYCIGVHGSLDRDIDLIAAPWESNACSAAQLIETMRDSLGATIIARVTKPLGRMAFVLRISLSRDKNIDISVCPRALPSMKDAIR